MLKSLRQQELELPKIPPLAIDPKLSEYLRNLQDVLVENSRLHQLKIEQFNYDTLADEATPSILNYYKHSYWVTGGTTTITNFDDGYYGQVITVIAEHSITITHGTNIHLKSGVNFSMTSGDTVTLILKDNDEWYEIGGGSS